MEAKATQAPGEFELLEERVKSTLSDVVGLASSIEAINTRLFGEHGYPAPEEKRAQREPTYIGRMFDALDETKHTLDWLRDEIRYLDRNVPAQSTAKDLGSWRR